MSTILTTVAIIVLSAAASFMLAFLAASRGTDVLSCVIVSSVTLGIGVLFVPGDYDVFEFAVVGSIVGYIIGILAVYVALCIRKAHEFREYEAERKDRLARRAASRR